MRGPPGFPFVFVHSYYATPQLRWYSDFPRSFFTGGMFFLGETSGPFSPRAQWACSPKSSLPKLGILAFIRYLRFCTFFPSKVLPSGHFLLFNFCPCPCHFFLSFGPTPLCLAPSCLLLCRFAIKTDWGSFLRSCQALSSQEPLPSLRFSNGQIFPFFSVFTSPFHPMFPLCPPPPRHGFFLSPVIM